MRLVRGIAALATSIALLAGCTGPNTARPGGPVASSSAAPSSSPSPSSPANPLCTQRPSPSPPAATATGSLPASFATVAAQVEQVRGLRFRRAVAPEAVTRRQIERRLRRSLSTSFPANVAAREDRVWTTIGILPAATDLRKAFVDYGTSQIIGYYDTQTHRLVFQGGTTPTPYQRFTLAHELTHALQDQYFDLSRLDRLWAQCQDERAEALLALAEGDSVQTQLQWASEDLSAGEIAQLQAEARAFPPPPSSTPRFVQQMFLFPYQHGPAFVQALRARGGERAVNDAFRHPPVSTEQILHPGRYPQDVPQPVQIPDLTTRLGAGWSLLDQEEVGEAWLLMLLELRLPAGGAEDAAAGWDGGLLRAWSDADHTAVVIETAWDTTRDASEFADAMGEWIRQQPAEVQLSGQTVRVLVGSDPAALGAVRAAAGQP